MKNPFVTNGYAGPEYFCDRVEETKTIVGMLANQNNLALISPRRIGKTDLIRHCFSQPEMQNNYYTFEVDIYATSSLNDFVNLFGKAVLDSLRPRGRSVWESFLNILSSVRAEIKFDINGEPSWGVGLSNIANPQVTLEEIFSYLQSADKPCLVAIDEFQQILKYPDGDKVEAALRTYIQRCSNANFIFAGSHRHLMGAIFTSPSRPFYQSVTILNIHPIALPKYLEFCKSKFTSCGKCLDDAVVELLYWKFQSVTSYMQKVMNILFMTTAKGETCTIDKVDAAIEMLLSLSSDTYETLLCQMPEKQRALFIAIAAEGRASAISSGSFVKKYRLISSSSVISAAKGLLEKDFVTQENGTYYVYDLMFVLWLKQKGLI